MKNKKILLAIFIIVFIAVATALFFIINNNNSKIDKGYQIFGNDYCNGHQPIQVVGWMFTSWTCKICKVEREHNCTDTPTICTECAEITGRCSICGKLQKNDY